MDNNGTERSTFLSLPREIRDRIYYYAYRSVYTIVSSKGKETYATLWDNLEQFRQPTRPSKDNRKPPPRLHEVCRQLQAETRLSCPRHGTFVFYTFTDFHMFLDRTTSQQRGALTRIAFHPSLFNGENEQLQDEAERIRRRLTKPTSNEAVGSKITTRLPNLKTILIFSRVRAALTLIEPCPPPFSSRVILFLITDEAVQQAYNGVLPETRVPPHDGRYIFAQTLIRNHSTFYLHLKKKLENQVKVVMQEV